MDQLFEAFGINVQLIIAQAVNFGVLLIALWYFLYKPVMKVLDERQKKIAQGVEDAERANEKLTRADDEAVQLVQKAETEAEGIVASARDAAGSEKMRLIKEAETGAAALTADAEARAKEASEKLLRESEKEIARLSILAAEKVMRAK